MHPPEIFMATAIQMAKANVDNGGGPFGALIVRGDTIVGRGVNRVTQHNDPTAHAEVVAIRDACTRLQRFKLEDCVIYTSCEPCPMCLGAIYWAGLSRIYFAATHRQASEAGFDDSFIYKEIPLAIHERSIPTTQLALENAAAPFVAWIANANRIDY
ncbi:MAG TPA: nucleoside deaminase [Saprospiraceae bacterium]|nr:nucleoside deaminase [Saprospiraceae bacterium]HMP25549.1 nucleoside deaminase [Saprospiraceae bacterium]